MNFYDALFNNNIQLHSDKIALECDDISYTYEQLDAAVGNLVKEFKSVGIGPHSKVMLMHSNPCNYTLIMLAILKAEAIPMPLYSKLSQSKLETMIESFEPNFLIKADNNDLIKLEDSESLSEKCSVLVNEIGDENLTVYSLCMETDMSLVAVKLILFTSGTTSTPKAIMLTKDNIMSNIYSICDYLKPVSDDNILLIKDLSHSSSITSELFIGLFAGCKIVMTTKIAMNQVILKLLQNKEISIFFAVPTLLKGIMEYKKLGEYDLSHLRIINFYGASMYYKDILKLVDIFPQANLFYSYGQTEASPRVTYIDKKDLLVKNKSCGRAIKNVSVHIEDENGCWQDNNTIGEVVVSGMNVMLGYYRNPAKTQKTVIDGMLHTGDYGYLDDDGFLYITGRKDNMFISSGKNIYPEEIEGVLTSNKYIMEALCLERKKDNETSDIIANVVLKDNNEFNYNEVLDYCKQYLELYKLPKEINVVPALEKTPSGKIKRREMNQINKINKNEVLDEILNKKTGEYIDVCVMYSGGKDSSFLLYLLKEVYGLRVKAVMVDNGFENAEIWKTMKDFPKRLGVELEIIKPDEKIFRELFNLMVVHHDKFAREKVNHVCFICNNLLWATVVKYSCDNGIPFVASGLSIDQLGSGRSKPLATSKTGNSIAEKSTQKIFVDAKSSLNLIEDEKYSELKEYFSEISEARKSVKTVYPYIYHDIPVSDIKEMLDKLGWQTPNGLTKNEYISSGCKIMQTLIYELEKLGMITLNEREQAKRMIDKGTLDASDIEFATYDARGKMVDLTDPIFKELQIKDFLISQCIKNNNEYLA